MQKLFRVLVLSVVMSAISLTNSLINIESYEYEAIPVIQEQIIFEAPPEPIVEEPQMSVEDIELIALVLMGEAQNQPEEGKRLVIDTILNRIDHERFPDTTHDVIYQRSQFTCMWNGRIDRCYVDEANCDLVRQELESRTNYEVIFFTAGRYSRYGVPMFKVGDHYFSSYN